MPTVTKVSDTQRQLESMLERLDGKKGLRDVIKRHILEPASAFSAAKANRLTGAITVLNQHGKEFSNVDDLVKYVRHVAGESIKLELGYLRQAWDGFARAPKTCKGFLDSLVTESAMRYAWAGKEYIVVGKGHDRKRVQLTLDGSVVSRYEYIESLMPGKLRDVRKRIKAGEGSKLSRAELVDIVESAAVKAASAKGVSEESARWRAEQAASRAVKSVISNSETKRLPGDQASADAYLGLIRKLIGALPDVFGEYEIVSKAELRAMRGKDLENAQKADLWDTLVALKGGIPKSADEELVMEVFRAIAPVQKMVGPYFMGELRPGVPVDALPVAAG